MAQLAGWDVPSVPPVPGERFFVTSIEIYNAEYSPGYSHPHTPAAVAATNLLGVPVPLNSLGVAAAERKIGMAGIDRQAVNDDNTWASLVQRIRDSDVDHHSVRIEDVQAAIANDFGIHPPLQVFTHAEDKDYVEGWLAAYFEMNKDVDRVLFECASGPITFDMAGVNRDTDGMWWPIGIDAVALEELRHIGGLNADGSVPSPAGFLALHRRLARDGDPQQMRLALLTLTPDNRMPLERHLPHHLENALRPYPTWASQLSPEISDMLVHAGEPQPPMLTYGAMAPGGPPPAATQRTIRGRFYAPPERDCCAMTALGNHLGVIVPPLVMQPRPEGGNLIADLVNAVRVVYRVPVNTKSYGRDEPALGNVSADLHSLLQHPGIDRITYEHSVARPTILSDDEVPDIYSHIATLAHDDQNGWVLHDRDDEVERYAQQLQLPCAHAPGGRVLVLGAAANVHRFLLARFNDAPQSHRRLAWFATIGDDRAEVAAIEPTRLRQRYSESLGGVDRVPGTERGPERFLALLANHHLAARSRLGRVASEPDQNEQVMSQTMLEFEATFPCDIGETRFGTPVELARKGQPNSGQMWDEYVKTFVESQQPKHRKIRGPLLNRYRYFLLTGTLVERHERSGIIEK